MKRFFALAALVLGLAACQTEPEGLNANVGGEVDATIAISIPETETRYGDGSNSALGVFNNGILGTEDDNVTMRYLMQIFDEGGRASDTYYVDYSDGKTVNFDVRLVPNRDYTFVVWADVVVNGEYDVDNHYKTKNDAGKVDLTNISLLGTWKPMDESRDAFTVTELVEDYTGASIINLELKRPFAKLRIVTTDMEQLNDLDIMPSKATVEYTTTHYNAFNAYEGKVIGDSKNRNIKHENFDIVKYDEDVEHDADMTIFTDYFFAKSEDEVVNFNLSVYEENGTIIGKTINFNTPIPARRNYLTTISGNILTDGNKIKVEVEDAFENAGDASDDAPYYQETISSVAELLAAIDANNGKYILISNLDVNGVTASTLAATRSTGAGTTINLNGYTITLKTNLTIAEDKTLTINDINENGETGAIINAGGKILNNGTLNIEGGNFGADTIENNGSANVSGGTFEEDAIVNNGSANVSGGTFEDNAIVNNGSVSVEGNNSGNEDRIIENSTNAVVSNIVYTVEELKAALVNGKVDEIIFGADLVGDATISQREGVNVYINGAGKKFDGTIYVDGNSRNPAAETLLIQDVNFESATDKDFIWADDASVENRYPHNITIKDCTFTGLEGAEVVAIRCRQTYNLTIEDCQATDVHSFGQITSTIGIAISGVTVNGQSGFNFLTSATNASITNCNITATKEDGYGIRVDATGSNTMNVKNCTIAAFRPIVLRKAIADFKLNLENNTLTPTDKYHIYVESGVLPTLNGADDLIVYPRDVVTSWSEFTENLAANKGSIMLGADITFDANYQLQKDVIIDLNGKSMTLPMINIHNKVTIKNGTINGKVYARKNSEIVFDNVKFSGAVADNLSTEGHLAIQGGCKSLSAKDCLFSPTSVSGSQTKPLSFEGGSSNLKFENCEFKSSPYKKQVYLNSLSATGSIEFINCNFNNKTPNIMFAATCPLTNVTMSGTTKLSSVTFEINRAKDVVTDEDWAHLRTLIANNSFGSVRVFYDPNTSEYIRQ